MGYKNETLGLNGLIQWDLPMFTGANLKMTGLCKKRTVHKLWTSFEVTALVQENFSFQVIQRYGRPWSFSSLHRLKCSIFRAFKEHILLEIMHIRIIVNIWNCMQYDSPQKKAGLQQIFNSLLFQSYYFFVTEISDQAFLKKSNLLWLSKLII